MSVCVCGVGRVFGGSEGGRKELWSDEVCKIYSRRQRVHRTRSVSYHLEHFYVVKVKNGNVYS